MDARDLVRQHDAVVAASASCGFFVTAHIFTPGSE